MSDINIFISETQKVGLTTPTIVLAYYTLFQSYRMTTQWDSAPEYSKQFENICEDVEERFEEDDDNSMTMLSFGVSLFCKDSIEKALDGNKVISVRT